MKEAENELKNNCLKKSTQTTDVWQALLFLVVPEDIETEDACNIYNTILGKPISVVCFVGLGQFGACWLLWSTYGLYFIWETVFLESFILHK